MHKPSTDILFLCLGNYFRSRYAEKLFNYLAAGSGVAASADSCGVRISPRNKGPLSIYTRAVLADDHKIEVQETERLPRKVEAEDMARASFVILTDAEQQLPYIEQLFGDQFNSKLVYWHIPDVTFNGEQLRNAQNDPAQLKAFEDEAKTVLQKIEHQVRELVSRL
jgi:protein-tyrosine phosphatase